MIEMLFLGSAAFAGGAHAIRKNRTQHHPPRRPARTDSLLVKAWKSAGAPHTDETMLADAVADLGGRAIGKGVRGAAQRGRRMKPWAEARWQRRQANGGTTSFIRRPRTNPGNGPGAPGDNTAQPGQPARPAQAVQSPKAAQPALNGRTMPQLPAGTGGQPRSPIPMPSGGPVPQPGTAGPARRAAGRSAGRGGGRSAARRARRAQPRMRITGPLNLDAPETDVEFLESCQELQQILRGIGVAVEDWTDEVIVRRMPPIVTAPLNNVSEGLVDAAACTALASMLFEAWFAEARAVAEAGIHFTGDDPT
ncbi:hypothetical protein [Actinomadura macrotermitis]|uniref:Uncharacterized protein n=1 Tax=Actinomadura macrotermitis TaxID=2585200 RepID=A0A7K0C356_9ACTN|nr:hypothetical protein [Actinomadura macrotermitis]MQY07254.1 hypothetical protein [Actinomadura macrotermitis]